MSLLGRMLHRRLVRVVRWNEQRVGAAKGLKAALRYVFPDHWSFLLGEIALYSFIVLVGTGIFLTLYYIPGDSHVIYHGSYAPLAGQEMSEAYRSVLNLSFNVPAGLLMRQVHHWAADVFVASIVLHLCRIFFTGAYRKPRDLNYFIGLLMLMLAILEGFAGYSLVDDLLSGMGLAIAYSVALSIPLIGAQLGYLVWDGAFPGSSSFLPRLEIVHVLLLPAALAVLITIHLAMIMRQHHSQFPGPGRRERNVVGTPMWPAYALRSLGLLLAVAAVLFLIGGVIQINPIWQWGPYHPYLSENGAQPDWYIGWLIGALRLMPNLRAGDRQPHDHPQPVLGRRAVPAGGVRGDVRLAVGRATVHGRSSPPRPARSASRPPDPHRNRRGVPQLGGDHLRRRIDRPPVLPAAHLLRRPDSFLADRRLGPADPDLLHHPKCLPVACGKERASATGMAGLGGQTRGRWRGGDPGSQPRRGRGAGVAAAGGNGPRRRR